MTALIVALAALAAPAAFARPQPGSAEAAASTEDCKRVRERLRTHASGEKTALCVTQTPTPPPGWTGREAPRTTRQSDPDATDAGRVSARGLRPDPAPRAVPRYCPTRLDALVTAGRFRSCAKSLVTFVEFDRRRGIIGRATFAATFWAQLRPRSRSWDYSLKLNGYRGTGTLTFGLNLAASARCIGGCRIYAARPPDGTRARVGPGAPVRGSWTMGSPGRRSLSHRFNAVLTASEPRAAPGRSASLGYLTRARCDSAAYLQSSGCVYPRIPGLFELSAAGVTEAARFYRDAQESLPNHPGRLDGAPLRRTRNATTIRANRRAASQRCGPRPPDQQCDEYPFASARAATSAFRVRFVPGQQNELVGSRLGTFFRNSRILDRDPFYVQIVG